jgi:hypothetical protein
MSQKPKNGAWVVVLSGPSVLPRSLLGSYLSLFTETVTCQFLQGDSKDDA